MCGTLHEFMRRNSTLKCCGTEYRASSLKEGERLPVGTPPYPNVRLIYIEGVGLGVAALRDLKKGTLIERCPALLVTKGFVDTLRYFSHESTRSELRARGFHELHHPISRVFPYRHSHQSSSLDHLLVPAWLSAEDRKKNKKHEAENYKSKPDELEISDHLLVLGYGMLYNHSREEGWNAHVQEYDHPSTGRRFIDIVARQDITAKQEIRINYGNMYGEGTGKGREEQWFRQQEPRSFNGTS